LGLRVPWILSSGLPIPVSADHLGVIVRFSQGDHGATVRRQFVLDPSGTWELAQVRIGPELVGVILRNGVQADGAVDAIAANSRRRDSLLFSCVVRGNQKQKYGPVQATHASWLYISL
jgi:hypothetical protein